MRFSPYRMWLAQGFVAVALLLFAGVVPAMGSESGVTPDTPQKSAQSDELSEKAQNDPQAKGVAPDSPEESPKEERKPRKKDRTASRAEPQAKRGASPQEAQGTPVMAKPERIKEIAYNAGLYAYPLVLADAVRRADIRAAHQAGGVDLSRQFFHSDVIPDLKRAPGILPRADSLYSLAWLELKKTPYLLEIPAMPGRHYFIQILDAWTRNLPAISARDAGGKSGKYIVLMQGEEIPANYAADYTPIFCSTSLCMLLARIQVKTPEDMDAARKAQQNLRLTPLFSDKLTGRAAHSDTAPVPQLAALDAEKFFSRFTGLLTDNPAPHRDMAIMGHLKSLGIEAGNAAFFSLDAAMRKAASDGCRKALDDMAIYFNSMSTYNDPLDMGVNGWQMSVMDVGTYGERYAMRALLAAADFGAARPLDVLQATLQVDASGKFLDGERNYVLRFEQGQLPPVEGFWSLTLYTAKQQLHDNAIQRHALTSGNRLVREQDGSTVVYLQHKAPDKKHEANWLPTPALGYFSLVLRLYAPQTRALNAAWRPPQVVLVPEKRKTEWNAPAQK